MSEIDAATTSVPPRPIDTRAFRQTLGRFVTGVTVITTEIDGQIRAMTANSFTSLSLEPPLVLFCVGKATRTGQMIHSASGFSVNILRHDQQALSTYFAGGWKEPQSPQFSFVSWSGGPRLEGCAAALGCAIQSIQEGGDHWIVIGRVLELYGTEEPCPPLVFCGGRYTTVRPAGPAESVDLTYLISGF
jgi:3-hydroxy-9,10-secoandrosta-1,3,5(10)-triene-9,17-dione monooxygenase reductase component